VLIVPVLRRIPLRWRGVGDVQAAAHRRVSEALDRIPVPEQDMARLEELVLAEITSLWQTDEVRSRRPTVYDEDQDGARLLRRLHLRDAARALSRDFEAALRAAYDLEIEPLELPQVLRFGSWIGGDRDGNPFVTPEVTRDCDSAGARTFAALLPAPARRDHRPADDERAAAAGERGAARAAARLCGAGAHAGGAGLRLAIRVRVLPPLRHLPEGAHPADAGAGKPGMGFRRRAARDALHAGAQGQDKLAQVLPAYCSVEDFLDDLETLRASLAEHEGMRIARTLIDPLILQVRTFGLHLHTLDIRQHARVHAAALQEAISDTIAPSLPGGLSRGNGERAGDLPRGGRVKGGCSPEAIRQYVISGASSVEDVLAVVRLARLGGVTVEGRDAAGPRSRPDAGAAVRVD
jgi:phosphoenolpyruvate carboxylase